MLSEDKPDGRAAIRRTELLWRNEALDTVADGGGSACAGEDSLLFPFPWCYAGLLRARAIRSVWHKVKPTPN